MASRNWKTLIELFTRRYVCEDVEDTNLKRCLNRWDLTSLGLGSVLGVGVYVLVGAVALEFAGPSIVLSFLIAAVASMFAGLCFAEFGARVPRAGSAYVYTYVTIGELVAFIIGWNVILEGIFGTASVARGLSMYIDSMCDKAITNWFLRAFPLPSHLMSPYFDFLSFLIVLVLGVLLAFGARVSASVNNIFSALNMSVILFVIVAGSFTADAKNWDIPASEVPAGFGTGGFFPYGAWGTLQGAALCFYGFSGFDVISSTGEEVLNPRKSIPIAIVIVLCVVFVVYASISTVITMMMPYYLLDKVAATSLAFRYVGWDWARWVVSVGAVTGIFASLFGSLFPVTRLLYAMANDGLIAPCFAYVSPSRKTPIVATSVCALLIATLSAILTLKDLIMMMCVGTLTSYTIVAACVVLLRYRSHLVSTTKHGYFKQLMGIGDREASKKTTRIIDVTLGLYILLCVTVAILGIHVPNPMIPVVILNAMLLMLLIVMTLQPKVNVKHLTFKTPLVPMIPCLSIYVNIHLMILVNIATWIRVLIWFLIGIPVYLLSLYFYKQCSAKRSKSRDHVNKNGTTVQIVIEAPSPTDTLNKINKVDVKADREEADQPERDQKVVKHAHLPFKTDEIIVQQAIIENNEEKEAKIIDLLDQVLQAEEDSYIEQISLKEEFPDQEIMTPVISEPIPHRKSLTELSDAGSDASLSIHDTKYNVVAQIHREDLSKVSEEEEKVDFEAVNDTTNEKNDNGVEHEQTFDESETNSHTDESGYSDTLDRNVLNDSVEIEDIQGEIPRIPTPPPMDESYFNNPYLFKKSYTIAARPTKQKSVEENEEEETRPRESVQSNTSQGTEDGNIVFGSSRQMRFMNKLNDLFQNKIAETDPGEEKIKRSNSTGDVNTEVEVVPELMRERPSLFADLKKELQALSVPILRPIYKEDTERLNQTEPVIRNDDDDTFEEDSSMSREDLKSKLENILATGGPNLLKPRVMKSNPPTPEEAYQTDTSSTESISKLPKMEKNDTLKRQKDKFGEVLNSFRLSLNKDDAV